MPQDTDNSSDLITIEEVSSMLTVPVATLRHWRNTGKGPAAARFGRSLRYRRADVLAYIDEAFASQTRSA